MLLLAALLQIASATADTTDRFAFDIPRIEAEVRIDGVLDEEVWTRAARLDGFSQYFPVDGRPAEQRTTVLAWYSPRALHFGIVAHANDPGAIRATLAERDNIGSDDRVMLFLDTFDDRRRAYLFGVNPFGVQLDGVRTEGSGNAGGGGFGGQTDYSPDFVFESRGQLTDSGYVVELSIPFASLRYSSAPVQQWGLQINRVSAATGYEDTWTEARRAGASFLAQAGVMRGLSGLERGVVIEAQPFVTATSDGVRDRTSDRFTRDDPDLSTGVNLQLGFTNLTIDATVNPDFSQVESDAGLVTQNERFAQFISEKRPFFLEGIELFSTPNQLVYTRRIADPIAGAKFTGKFGRYSVAHLSALDQRPGRDALANIARLRRDISRSSTAGLTLTDYEIGGAYNRVAAADARVVFKRLYFAEAQLGASWTRDALGSRSDPIWKVEVDRTGHSFGFNYGINGIGDEFSSALGFVPRRGIANAEIRNRLSWYGERGSLIERVNVFVSNEYAWRYDAFGRGSRLEGEDGVSLNLNLRGGWSVDANIDREFFRLEPEEYAGTTVLLPGGATPFVPPDELDGLVGFSLEVESPTWSAASVGLEAQRAAVVIFDEAAEGVETELELDVSLRPTTDVRIGAGAVYSRLTRERDDSEFARTIIPRLRAEYQITRALFVRVIGEYRSERRDALRDPLTGTLLAEDGVASAPEAGGFFRHEWLVSFEPTPGTVAYLGYISAHESPSATSARGFRREADGLFLKLAYRFRRQ
ncbi:MAG TPA: DUF5916 domain-containing protein [Gemmatimonadaceae bacterium]|nr:DUF5916 domain-containing protein [Gemmatimonadaceae bacterium]